MTFECVMYAFGMASVYFGIYYFWQMAVGFIFGTVLMWTLSSAGAAGAALETMYRNTIADCALYMTLVAHALTLLTYLIILRVQKKNIVTELELKPLTPLGYVLMPVLGISLGVFVTVLLSVIPFPETWIEEYANKSSLITSPALWITLLVTVISAPVVEEVVFRGFMQSKLKSGIPMFASMIISSVLFGLVHSSLIWMIYAGLLGFVLALIREKLGSLIAPMLVHMGFNICGVVLGYFESVDTTVFIASGVVSIAVIAYVMCTSKHKIEFFIKKKHRTQELSEQKLP